MTTLQNTTRKTVRLPSLSELERLVKNIKSEICDDYRAFDEDTIPGIQLTVAMNDAGEWDYQTGDNSYSGGAYSFPHWAVVGVYRRSNSREVAADIRSQLADLVSQ